jgi:hypothetical protein
METVMLRIHTILAALLVMAGPASAGDVYVTVDAQGNRVYTDRPDRLPANKIGVASAPSDPAEAEARYSDQMQQYEEAQDATDKARTKSAQTAKARELTAEDRAKRCVEARSRYEATMNAIRVYEEGPDGQRRYLSAEEIDTTRANAKQAMDEFCGGQ